MKTKLERADALRKADIKADRELGRTIREWEEKRKKAKTAKRRANIDKVYGRKAELADKRSSKTYKNYWDFIHKNFSKEEINASVTSAGGFHKKSFLDRLFKASKPKKKATKRAAKKSKPKKKK
ncbi:MAG: hypothetical protein IJX88_05250 [Clostridia bacterium]|nr:hypothetical protein [Clostridia bacterium]